MSGTRHDFRPAAHVARNNGWGVGTHLVGDEGYGPSVIVITALGEDLMLARCVSRRGEQVEEREATWTLGARDWRVCDVAASSGASPERFNDPISIAKYGTLERQERQG